MTFIQTMKLFLRWNKLPEKKKRCIYIYQASVATEMVYVLNVLTNWSELKRYDDRLATNFDEYITKT